MSAEQKSGSGCGCGGKGHGKHGRESAEKVVEIERQSENLGLRAVSAEPNKTRTGGCRCGKH